MLTDLSISKENIFEPLGMKLTSFYLTPELRELAVPLAFRDADGKLVRFTSQTPLIEQDPSKGTELIAPSKRN